MQACGGRYAIAPSAWPKDLILSRLILLHACKLTASLQLPVKQRNSSTELFNWVWLSQSQSRELPGGTLPPAVILNLAHNVTCTSKLLLNYTDVIPVLIYDPVRTCTMYGSLGLTVCTIQLYDWIHHRKLRFVCVQSYERPG